MKIYDICILSNLTQAETSLAPAGALCYFLPKINVSAIFIRFSFSAAIVDVAF